MLNTPFREAVGSLMHVMVMTRPDIAYAVGQVAQFAQNPGKQHWRAVKRILAYLKKPQMLAYASIKLILHFQVFVTQIMLETFKLADPPAALLSSTMVVQSHGLVDVNNVSHYPPQKQNLLQLLRPQKKRYGYNNCCLKSTQPNYPRR